MHASEEKLRECRDFFAQHGWDERYLPQGIQCFKLYPANSKAIMTNLLPHQSHEECSRNIVISNHYLLAHGIHKRLERRTLHSLYRTCDEWEASSPPVFLMASILYDYICAIRFKWHRGEDLCQKLIDTYGISGFLQFIGCTNIESVDDEVIKGRLSLAAQAIASTKLRASLANGTAARNSDDFVLDIFCESVDAPRPSTKTGEIEVEFIRLDPNDMTKVQAKYQDVANYHPISTDTLQKFVITKKAAVDALLTLLGRHVGFPFYLQPGARDDNAANSSTKRNHDGDEIDDDCRGNRQFNCLVEAVLKAPTHTVSQSAKNNLRKACRGRPFMIGVQVLREIMDDCVKSVFIEGPISGDITRKAMEDTDVVYLAIFTPRGSLVKHTALIYSTGICNTRHSNGIIYDPAEDFGYFPRCPESFETLGCDEITELYQLRKRTLSDTSIKALRKLMPDFEWPQGS